MEAIQVEILNLAIVAIVALVGFVTKRVTSFLKQKGIVANLQANKEFVKIVVNAVEQTYNTLGGEEKLNVAKLELVKLMNEKGLKISEKEIDTLIESAVKEMNDTVKQELKKDAVQSKIKDIGNKVEDIDNKTV